MILVVPFGVLSQDNCLINHTTNEPLGIKHGTIFVDVLS